MLRPTRSILLLALVAATPVPLIAQSSAARAPRRASPAAETRALETITETDFRGKLGALAHDSSRGRETPSPELDKAAAWIAARFRDAGLRPAGDGGGFLQRFQLRHTRLDSLTTVTVSGPGHTTRWAIGREILFLGGQPSEARDLPVVLMAGVPADSARPFGDVPVRGAAVILVVAANQIRGAVLNPLAQRAMSEGVAAFAVVAEVPTERWAQMARRPAPERWALAGALERTADAGIIALFQVRHDAATDLLRAAGEDPATILTPERQGVRPLRGFALSAAMHEVTLEEPMVANVVGILEGSDRALRDEAVIFTGHMDHVGVVGGRCQPSQAMPADSVCNGADDNASGTVGVIELAEAFAALRPRPARTLVFAAVTAEERGLYGARFYLDHPVVPIERTAAVINLDMIARNPRDTVGLVGKDYSSLGALVDRMAREHPELRLVPKEHPGMYPNSDHYPFAQRGVPALFFFSGIHPDLHTAADNLDRADTEQAARIVRLAFRVGLEVANAVERPTWDPQARTQVVQH
jgi:hypothetical protein